MGGILSRTGTNTYYANYEKAFDRLEKESSRVLDRRVKRRKNMDACSNIGFWTTAMGLCLAILVTAYLQQVGSQRWYQKSVTILGAWAVPLISALLFRGVLWSLRFVEARDERFLRKLMDAKRKMIKDLKDSTRFERTAALIKKYDPDEQAHQSPRANATATANATANTSTLRRRSVTAPPTNGSSHPTTPRPAASAAVTVATETGKALMPMFESLANNLVGDNPVLLQEVQQLRDENALLKARNAELEVQLAEKKDTEPPSETAEKAQVASSG
ncbi:hypothetical protein VOLCADRAFT_106225 [Volvox carteri f. nagariensis]|uniref:Uncharacterized protein n=1 Tax=Volvox carteri f. nagariensis TaxID=3068 RepID=D8U5Y1_VOLCA|nr:uncharacterized protein VOLCADRAFT_106225 [Volvox carteri f. nagariensis]EFJ44839.1 hypothetical protein VOLCADRAFT_106225 [Volvox carteri f. nagariensis]|eukprot:XP_002954122.1 hypothetical protein VOLCADRAFT_106225 [Volvox carteri f. nagariensis]